MSRTSGSSPQFVCMNSHGSPPWMRDITTPEIKAAWQQGRKELFYPARQNVRSNLGEQD